jgi:hypothetical protein
LWGDMLSPVGILITSVLFLNVYLKAQTARISWFMIFLSSAAWFAADVLWAVVELGFGISPEDIGIFKFLYLLPDIFLLLAVLFFIIPQAGRWNKNQLILDVAVLTASIAILLWVLYFHKDTSEFMDFFKEYPLLTMYVIADTLTLSGIVTWYFSVRSGRMSRALKGMLISFSLYIVSDLYYSYLSYSGLYTGNTIIDSFFILFFLLFSLFADYIQRSGRNWYADSMDHVRNVGLSKKGFFLLAAPFMVFITVGPDYHVIIQLLVLFLIYEAISVNLQNNLSSKLIIEQSRDINKLLEERISERTQELARAVRDLDTLAKEDFATGMYNRRFFIGELDRICLLYRS